MDFIQLENAVKISEAESINQASMNLYLTQSALNQQLLRLEKAEQASGDEGKPLRQGRQTGGRRRGGSR